MSPKTTGLQQLAAMRTLEKDYKRLLAFQKNFDLCEAEKVIRNRVFSQSVESLVSEWKNKESDFEKRLEEILEYIRSDEYGHDIKDALQKKGLRLEGDYPEYRIHPFNLFFDLERKAIILSMGRKKKILYSWEPETVSQWVTDQYKKVAESSFHSESFLKDLLQAYEWTEKALYHTDKKMWGRPVPLEMIYKISTIRKETKKDFPLDVFLYQIGRLVDSSARIELDNMVFEFGHSRNQGKTYDIPSSKGRTNRFSSLTIHEERK